METGRFMDYHRENEQVTSQALDPKLNTGDDEPGQFGVNSTYLPGYPQPYLSVVIPAYNEEKRLPGTLKTVLEYLEAQSYPAEVIVVDDGSEDGTTGIVQRLMAQREHAQQKKCELRLIASEHRGKGYTVRRGMLNAKGRFVLFSDADLSTPIQDVEKLLQWLEQGYDVAVGSREGQEAHRYGEPFYRHLMGRIFNRMVRFTTGAKLEDTQCGFKAFSHAASTDLFGRLRLYGEGSGKVKGPMVTGFDVEVLFLARKRGYRVQEVPVNWFYVAGSKVNPLKDSVRMVRDIVKVKLNDLRGLYKDER
jgi:glycosyltransferase involved in cell wall biosynthesis